MFQIVVEVILSLKLNKKESKMETAKQEKNHTLRLAVGTDRTGFAEASLWTEDLETERIAEGLTKANAKHIVRCVNSHNELITALKSSLPVLKEQKQYFIVQQIEEALRKAGI